MHSARPRLEALADGVIRRLRRSLPAPLRERFDGLALFLDERPAPELVAEGVPADTMGLFEGPAVDEEGGLEVSARMTLFLQPLWEEAGGDDRAFCREVRRTLLHELGHYLGLDEAELADRDLD